MVLYDFALYIIAACQMSTLSEHKPDSKKLRIFMIKFLFEISGDIKVPVNVGNNRDNYYYSSHNFVSGWYVYM